MERRTHAQPFTLQVSGSILQTAQYEILQCTFFPTFQCLGYDSEWRGCENSTDLSGTFGSYHNYADLSPFFSGGSGKGDGQRSRLHLWQLCNGQQSGQKACLKIKNSK